MPRSRTSLPARIFGILNITADSFSDGGRYLEPRAALARARQMLAAGAYAIDVGAAASHPNAEPVDVATEIARLDAVLDTLLAEGVRVSVDSWKKDVQRHCLRRGVAFLNDIRGFPDPSFDEELAASDCGLILMHSTSREAIAERRGFSPEAVVASVYRFFDERVGRLVRAGVDARRIILDPGMGLFLSTDPAASLAVLAELPRLKETFGLPVLVSVSRKSFLGELCGKGVSERGPATLAAEVLAALAGADYLRTHDVEALADGLKVAEALRARGWRPA